MFTVNCIKKTKIKKKEAGNSPFFKKQPEIVKTLINPTQDLNLHEVLFTRNALISENNLQMFHIFILFFNLRLRQTDRNADVVLAKTCSYGHLDEPMIRKMWAF